MCWWSTCIAPLPKHISLVQLVSTPVKASVSADGPAALSPLQSYCLASGPVSSWPEETNKAGRIQLGLKLPGGRDTQISVCTWETASVSRAFFRGGITAPPAQTCMTTMHFGPWMDIEITIRACLPRQSLATVLSYCVARAMPSVPYGYCMRLGLELGVDAVLVGPYSLHIHVPRQGKPFEENSCVNASLAKWDRAPAPARVSEHWPGIQEPCLLLPALPLCNFGQVSFLLHASVSPFYEVGIALLISFVEVG